MSIKGVLASAVIILFISTSAIHPVPVFSVVYGDLPLSTYQDDDIIEDETWTLSGSPYYINDTVTISADASLSIDEGVEVLMGQNAGIVIDGSLFARGVNDTISFRPKSGEAPGSWEGFIARSGSIVNLEGVQLKGSTTVINATSSRIMISNSSISNYVTTSVLDMGSVLTFSNTTFDNSTLFFKDTVSFVESFSLMSIHILDIYSQPRGNVNVEIADMAGMVWTEHLVNDTGIVPEVLVKGFTYNISGTNLSAGRYDVVMRDQPFTHYHNDTILIGGLVKKIVYVTFSWPPEMTNISDSFFAYEDTIGLISSWVLDRNQVGSVDISISSENVSYDREFGELTYVYNDERISRENVYINLSDGYDNTSYAIDVIVTPRDDPPVFTLPFTLLYIREGTPYRFEVILEDEDTSMEDLIISSDDPRNVSFDKANRSFVLTYGDGTDPEFKLNLTVDDGNTEITKEVTVFFTPVYFPPRFLVPLPEIDLLEDSYVEVDLSRYLYDPDIGSVLTLDIRVEDYDLFSAYVNGTVLNISSIADANGNGRILLKLVDERNMSDSEYLNVTVLPVNDPPLLTNHEITSMGMMRYRFNVTYTDIDGDLPSRIYVSIDGKEYDLSLSSAGDLSPENGLIYYAVIELEPGLNNYTYICSDGLLGHSIGPFGIFVSRPVEVRYLEAYQGWLNITIWYTGGAEIDLVADLTGDAPLGLDEVLVASFRIELLSGHISDILVMAWIGELNSDVVGEYCRVVTVSDLNSSQVLGLNYDVSLGVLSFHLGTTELGNSVYIMSLLDPDLDSDNDGYKNLIDEFPEDPDEWNDNDNDGIGDNADPDDDNDGFDDDLEIQAGTDPFSKNSFPLDTDNDGIFDYLDEDDDGDGMPDEWELKYGLDPKDPSDASKDNDGDGKNNLREYLDGTDPISDIFGDGDDGQRFPTWAIVVIASTLIVLLGVSILLFLTLNRRHREEIEEDWTIREELDPEDAVDCPSCSNVYPLKFDECPFCGELNPFNEEVE